MKRKYIKVCGRKVKIIKTDLDVSYAEFYSSNDTIYIDASITDKEVYKKSILHECIHAVFAYSGLNELISDAVEEAIARSLEYNYIDIVTNYNKTFR